MNGMAVGEWPLVGVGGEPSGMWFKHEATLRELASRGCIPVTLHAEKDPYVRPYVTVLLPNRAVDYVCYAMECGGGRVKRKWTPGTFIVSPLSWSRHHALIASADTSKSGECDQWSGESLTVKLKADGSRVRVRVPNLELWASLQQHLTSADNMSLWEELRLGYTFVSVFSSAWGDAQLKSLLDALGRVLRDPQKLKDSKSRSRGQNFWIPSSAALNAEKAETSRRQTLTALLRDFPHHAYGDVWEMPVEKLQSLRKQLESQAKRKETPAPAAPPPTPSPPPPSPSVPAVVVVNPPSPPQPSVPDPPKPEAPVDQPLASKIEISPKVEISAKEDVPPKVEETASQPHLVPAMAVEPVEKTVMTKLQPPPVLSPPPAALRSAMKQMPPPPMYSPSPDAAADLVGETDSDTGSNGSASSTSRRTSAPIAVPVTSTRKRLKAATNHRQKSSLPKLDG